MASKCTSLMLHSKPVEGNYGLYLFIYFFLKSETEARIVNINKSEIIGKNVFNGDFFEVTDSHEPVTTKNLEFPHFFRFVILVLTLRR